MKRSRSLVGAWMSRAAAVAVAVMVSLALVAQEAEARRLGGGTSFGRQSPNVTRQQSSPPANNAVRPSQPPAAQPPVQPSGNRWLGPIAGLAAGLGIAALLSHFGLGGAFADGLGSLLLIALLAFAAVFVWRMLRGARSAPPLERRMEPAYGVAGAGGAGVDSAPLGSYTPTAGSARPGSVAALSEQAAPWGVPADFDVPGFLRNAKVYFVRLQAAWDEKNLADIRQFTTPEVFAEIRMQIEEEKGAQNRTDVVTLEAELLGIETGAADYLASVRFTGTLRENDRSAPEPFDEVWNLTKPKDGQSGWLLAGIQQLH